MSLTSLISDCQELRNFVKNNFSKPQIDKSLAIKAVPQSNRHSMIGTAFDYLFRFRLGHINNGLIIEEPWIAEEALRLLDGEVYDKAEGIIRSAKQFNKNISRSGKIRIEAIRTTIQLAYIDPVFRAGVGREYIGLEPEKEDIRDLHRICSIIEPSISSRPRAIVF